MQAAVEHKGPKVSGRKHESKSTDVDSRSKLRQSKSPAAEDTRSKLLEVKSKPPAEDIIIDDESTLVAAVTPTPAKTTEEALETQFRLIEALDKATRTVQLLAQGQADTYQLVESLIADVAACFEVLEPWKSMTHLRQLQHRFQQQVLLHPNYRKTVGSYLERERAGLSEALAQSQQKQNSEPLLLFIRASLKRTSKVSVGELLFHILQVWKSGLQEYCAWLESLANPPAATSLGSATVQSPPLAQQSLRLPTATEFKEMFSLRKDKAAPAPGVPGLKPEAVVKACESIKQIEAMIEAVQHLETAVRRRMLPYWRERVSLDSVSDQYRVVIHHIITLLSTELVADTGSSIQQGIHKTLRCTDGRYVEWVDPAMARLRGQMLPAQEGMSCVSYSHLCNSTLPSIASHLSDWLLSSALAHKVTLTDSVTERLCGNILKLKKHLLALYVAPATAASAVGTAVVAAGKELQVPRKIFCDSFDKVEIIFKLVCCPPEALVSSFKALMMPHSAKDAAGRDLLAILILRNLPVVQQKKIAEQYNGSGIADEQRITIPDSFAVMPNTMFTRLWQ